MKIIFATQNRGKGEEVKELFRNTGIEIFTLSDLGNKIEIEETGKTLLENALIKARSVYEIYHEPVVADDSGLEIEQLEGRPGVYSARYAGENCSYSDNNLKVIQELSAFESPHKAKFLSCAVYYDGKNEFTAIGELPGRMISEPRGNQGFGYDPIFIPDGYETTIAEMNLEEKNKISHRARSFELLKDRLTVIAG